MVPSTWIVLAVATVGAIVNADFCSGGDADDPGSPDVTIMEIVALMQPDGGFLKDVLGYWVIGVSWKIEDRSWELVCLFMFRSLSECIIRRVCNIILRCDCGHSHLVQRSHSSIIYYHFGTIGLCFSVSIRVPSCDQRWVEPNNGIHCHFYTIH